MIRAKRIHFLASNDKCGPWSSPLIIPFAWNEDKKRVTSVTVQQAWIVFIT